MKWIKVSDRLPSPEIDGEKVLLFQTIKGRSAIDSMIIMDTNLIRHFWLDDNFWMPLPSKPQS